MTANTDGTAAAALGFGGIAVVASMIAWSLLGPTSPAIAHAQSTGASGPVGWWSIVLAVGFLAVAVVVVGAFAYLAGGDRRGG